MKVNFFNQTNQNIREYEKVIKNVFKTIELKKEFNIIFVDLAEIQRINKEFRHIDKPTDVISFALCDDEEYDKNQKELGDIFICIEKAFAQAAEYGHSKEREFAFLAVHGYLHLCGFDHQTKEEEKIMFEKQDEILNKAGITR
ncbi:MAG: rRNA maturation RNase YbeY [Acholeplasmatales bacterium]|nr:rRNA maturation RNase YbeY [Acholeplasmatales bacterium]